MKKKFCAAAAFILIFALLAGCGASESASSAQKNENNFSAGTVSDNKYVNSSAGLTFIIPEDWIIASEDETRSILNADPSDTSTVYDILTGAADNSEMMYLLSLDLSKQIGGSLMTEDDMLDTSVDALKEVEEAGTDSYEFDDYADFEICGVTWRGVTYVSASGVYSATYMHKMGKNLLMMGIVSRSAASRDYIMAHFTDDASSIPEKPVEEPVAAGGDDFVPGVIENGVYASSYLGLSFAPPEGWLFASDEELAQMMSSGAELVGSSGAFSQAVLDYSMIATIYDMYAVSADSSTNVQITLENLNSYIGGGSMSEADYIEALKTSFASIDVYTSTFGDTSSAAFGGFEFTVLPSVITDYGMYQDFYLCRVDKYMLCITITGAGDNSQDVLQYFSALD